MKSFVSKTTALILIAGSSLQAATKTRDGGAATSNWSDASNWNTDGTPTSSDVLLLDNSTVNPLPQINAQSGANCGTLTLDGAISGTFLNYAGATPLVTNLYGASVNAANTGPLINIIANAPVLLTVSKINFQLRTNGSCPQSLKDRYQQVYTTSDLYDNSATPNQRFMTCTASYLANGVWGPSVNSVSSASYATGDPTGKAYLESTINNVPFRGYPEHNSTQYLVHTVGPMMALGPPSGGLQTVTITIPKTLAGPSGKLFGRLRVSQP